MRDILKELALTEFDHRKLWHNLVLFLVVLMCVMICFSASEMRDEDIEYPIDTAHGKDFWVQQFDAFEKGQLNIDVEPSDELAALENPYDPAQREGIYYLWDRAYYEGNYYSYFGIAPILTVYYPYYYLTGALPSIATACLYMAAAAMLFLGLFYRELLIRFCRGANLWLAAALLVGSAFSAGVFVSLAWSDSYYVAVISAIEWSMIFLFLAFRAMRARNTALRAVLLALSAAALTMTVWSRPTVALMCLFVVPIFVFYAFDKKINIKDKIISISSFAVPLCIGAFAVMWYNAARFGSPLDFGSAYQLTVSDISKNKLDISMLGDSLYHFFFRGAAPTGKFPFFETVYISPEYDRYFYTAKAVGAFSFGIPAAALFAPFACGPKKEPCKFVTLLLGGALCVFVAFFDYCYAGLDLRYIIDILPMLTLIGAVTLLCAHKEAHGLKSVRLSGIITVIIIILCIVSVLMTVGVTRMNPSSHIFPIITE